MSRLHSGLLWMGGAAFFFSLMTLFIKLAGRHLPSQKIVLVRSAVTLIYSYAAVRWAGVSPWGQRRGVLVLRGLFGFGAMICFYLALTKLPLADTTAIFFSNPVLTALFAAAFRACDFLSVLRIRVVEPAAGLPLRALVAVGRHPARLL